LCLKCFALISIYILLFFALYYQYIHKDINVACYYRCFFDIYYAKSSAISIIFVNAF